MSAERENIIQVEHLNKKFVVNKQSMEALHDINLQVKKGEFITIVGHNGCGKSTLLKIICGLVEYEDGVVERNGHPVTGPGPKCGMVFQDHRLLPWLKIKDNVGFGLGDLSNQERDEKVRKHLELVGLAGFENSYPSQLSGGDCYNEARYRGYLEALHKYDMEPEAAYIIQTGQTEAEGYAAMQRFLQSEDRPTGIYCANDITAIGMLKFLGTNKNRYYVPSIIASDDIEEAQYTRPMLTTVGLPKEEMGKFALYLLLDRMRGGHKSVVRTELEGKLMIRNSCTTADEGGWSDYCI